MSQEALAQAHSVSTDLLQQMDASDFADLPTLQWLNIETIGANLAAKNRVSNDAWDFIAQKMRMHGFSAVLAYFEERISVLMQKTEILVHQITELSCMAEKAEVHRVLEENLSGNIKGAFLSSTPLGRSSVRSSWLRAFYPPNCGTRGKATIRSAIVMRV